MFKYIFKFLQHGANNSIQSMAMNRWSEFLDKWEAGMEVHTLGDMYLNHLYWTKESLLHSNQS